MVLSFGAKGFVTSGLPYLRHAQIVPLSAAMNMRVVHIPLQIDTNMYEELVCSISGVPRHHIIRWYIAKVENGQAVVELVHTAGENDSDLQKPSQQKDGTSKVTSSLQSYHNAASDSCAEYGRQPKPTEGKVKHLNEVADNEAIHREGSKTELRSKDATETSSTKPVEIEIDPFAYIL